MDFKGGPSKSYAGKRNLREEMWDAISGSAGGFGSPWPNHSS